MTKFSKEFYEDNRNRFIGERDIITPENDLSYALKPLEGIECSSEEFEKISHLYAQKVYDKLKKELLNRKPLYLKTLNCKDRHYNHLGYTTERQGIEAAFRIVTHFEFNCLLLNEFKEKHQL